MNLSGTITLSKDLEVHMASSASVVLSCIAPLSLV
nr:MAG TPA: hypothetical protein [Crassvirales sp.]